MKGGGVLPGRVGPAAGDVGGGTWVATGSTRAGIQFTRVREGCRPETGLRLREERRAAPGYWRQRSGRKSREVAGLDGGAEPPRGGASDERSLRNKAERHRPGAPTCRLTLGLIGLR